MEGSGAAVDEVFLGFCEDECRALAERVASRSGKAFAGSRLAVIDNGDGAAVSTDWAALLGGGAYAVTYQGNYGGQKVALRIVKTDSKKAILSELSKAVNIEGCTLRTHGVTWVRDGRAEGAGLFLPCVVMELCEHRDMDSFVRKFDDVLSLRNRVQLMLQTLMGLMQLKRHKVVWR